MVGKRENANLGDMLLREGLIGRVQYGEAVKRSRETGKSVAQTLVDMGVITESVKMSFLQKKLGYDFFSLEDHKPSDLVFTYIPRSFAVKHHLAPVNVVNDQLVVAMDDPSDLGLLDNLKATVGMPVQPVIASSSDIDAILKRYPQEDEEEDFEVEKKRPFYMTAISVAAFIFFGFIFPIIVIIFTYYKSEVFRQFYMPLMDPNEPFNFDVFFYTLLGGSFWIIIVWEIHGLLFDRTKSTEPSETE